ncbi:hypothetical protein ACMHYB_46960 [Sorangium sp. So ce1128]
MRLDPAGDVDGLHRAIREVNALSRPTATPHHVLLSSDHDPSTTIQDGEEDTGFRTTRWSLLYSRGEVERIHLRRPGATARWSPGLGRS